MRTFDPIQLCVSPGELPPVIEVPGASSSGGGIRPNSPPNVEKRVLLKPEAARLVEGLFAQSIRIGFTGRCQIDDFPGDDRDDRVLSICKTKRCKSAFERKAHDPLGLGIDRISLEIWRDRH